MPPVELSKATAHALRAAAAPPDGARASLSLETRASLLRTVLGSMQVTDSTGARLDAEAAIDHIVGVLREVRRRRASVFLIGNGGSAAIASHTATDFLNVGRLRAMTLHDSSLLTCMA